MIAERPTALRTARLVLTPLGPEHAPALFEALRDPEIYRYVPGDAPVSVGTLEARYRRTSAGPAARNERWWNWAVATPHAQRPFGTVELSLRDAGATALLGYLFGRDAWGHGFATEAALAAIAYTHKHAGTTAFDAFIDTRNERSIRLAERLDMRRIETIVAADHFKGFPSDEYHYRLYTEPKERR